MPDAFDMPGCRLGEPTNRKVRIDLAIDLHAIGKDLGTVGRDEIHTVLHRGEKIAEAIVPAPGARDETHTALPQGEDEVERLRRHLAVFVEERAIHIGGDEFYSHDAQVLSSRAP